MELKRKQAFYTSEVKIDSTRYRRDLASGFDSQVLRLLMFALRHVQLHKLVFGVCGSGEDDRSSSGLREQAAVGFSTIWILSRLGKEKTRRDFIRRCEMMQFPQCLPAIFGKSETLELKLRVPI